MRVRRADDGGDAELAGQHGGVAQRPALAGDHRRRRSTAPGCTPGRADDDEHVARFQLVERFLRGRRHARPCRGSPDRRRRRRAAHWPWRASRAPWPAAGRRSGPCPSAGSRYGGSTPGGGGASAGPMVRGASSVRCSARRRVRAASAAAPGAAPVNSAGVISAVVSSNACSGASATPAATIRRPSSSSARRSRPSGHSAVFGPLSSRRSIASRAWRSTSSKRARLGRRAPARAPPRCARRRERRRRLRRRRAMLARISSGHSPRVQAVDVVPGEQLRAAVAEVAVERVGRLEARWRGRRRARSATCRRLVDQAARTRSAGGGARRSTAKRPPTAGADRPDRGPRPGPRRGTGRAGRGRSRAARSAAPSSTRQRSDAGAGMTGDAGVVERRRGRRPGAAGWPAPPRRGRGRASRR